MVSCSQQNSHLILKSTESSAKSHLLIVMSFPQVRENYKSRDFPAVNQIMPKPNTLI